MNISGTPTPEVLRAEDRAREDARHAYREPAARALPPARVRVAMGDPQAPLRTVLAVLDARGLLGADGRLRGDVRLWSLGDHFDWGGPADALRAAADGTAVLAWLAAHPREQVALVAGNHDLARLGELATFDDESFAHARDEATVIYANRDSATYEDDERSFRARWPSLPGSEIAARDFAAFDVAQRTLVHALLRAGRLQIAQAVAGDLLLLHAGVTTTELAAIGVPAQANAWTIAAALNARLAEAVAAWDGSPLAIPHLHRPGDAATGEGDGMFYHRAAFVQADKRPGPRRFDPRTLPKDVTQVIGHIRDGKARKLLGPWSDPDDSAGDGPLRTLVTDGAKVRYARGIQACAAGEARIIFADGGMSYGPPDGYELLDLDRRKPVDLLAPDA